MAQTALPVAATWNGTATVTIGNTSGAAVGDSIRLKDDPNSFEIITVTTNVSYTITNPLSLTIPSGTDTTFNVTDPEFLGLQFETDQNAELTSEEAGEVAGTTGSGAGGSGGRGASAPGFIQKPVGPSRTLEQALEVRRKLIEGQGEESPG